jgi:hypothetical protein
MIRVLGFDSRRGLGIFLFNTASRTALGPTHPEALTLEVKRPGRETDHSPPSNAKVKEWVALYLHSPNTSSWRGARLRHRDNFTFTTEPRISLIPHLRYVFCLYGHARVATRQMTHVTNSWDLKDKSKLRYPNQKQAILEFLQISTPVRIPSDIFGEVPEWIYSKYFVVLFGAFNLDSRYRSIHDRLLSFELIFMCYWKIHTQRSQVLINFYVQFLSYFAYILKKKTPRLISLLIDNKHLLYRKKEKL